MSDQVYKKYLLLGTKQGYASSFLTLCMDSNCKTKQLGTQLELAAAEIEHKSEV